MPKKRGREISRQVLGSLPEVWKVGFTFFCSLINKARPPYQVWGGGGERVCGLLILDYFTDIQNR